MILAFRFKSNSLTNLNLYFQEDKGLLLHILQKNLLISNNFK